MCSSQFRRNNFSSHTKFWNYNDFLLLGFGKDTAFTHVCNVRSVLLTVVCVRRICLLGASPFDVRFPRCGAGVFSFGNPSKQIWVPVTYLEHCEVVVGRRTTTFRLCIHPRHFALARAGIGPARRLHIILTGFAAHFGRCSLVPG